jgi:hypothetical protein
MGHFEKVIPIFQTEGIEELQRELDEIREREMELYNEMYERQTVRVQLWALKGLQPQPELEPELKRTQSEFLHEELLKAFDQRVKWHREEVEKVRKQLSEILKVNPNSCSSFPFKRRSW